MRESLRDQLQRDGIDFSTTDSRGRGFLHAIPSLRVFHEDKVLALRFLLLLGHDPNA